MTKHRLALIVGVIVLVGLLSWVAVAVAQPAGGGGPGGGGRNFGRMMGMMPPAIAVAGDAVFVVRGNMIYKFSADTLELLAQAEIPMPTPPTPPPATPGQ